MVSWYFLKSLHKYILREVYQFPLSNQLAEAWKKHTLFKMICPEDGAPVMPQNKL
jgi:hypothetical protein